MEETFINQFGDRTHLSGGRFINRFGNCLVVWEPYTSQWRKIYTSVREPYTFQKTCFEKTCFVARNTRLSRQTHVCRNKTFVASKMRLVAAPANDRAPDRPMET